MNRIISFSILVSLFMLSSACGGAGGEKKETDSATQEKMEQTQEGTQEAGSEKPTEARAEEEGEFGTGYTPGVVWDIDNAQLVLQGAVVTATINGAAAGSATTDAQGKYRISGLSAGKTYTYTANKAGYKTSSLTKVYENEESLPGFGLKRIN